VDLDIVAGAVDRLERRLAVQVNLDGNFLKRAGAEFLGVERVDILADAAVGLMIWVNWSLMRFLECGSMGKMRALNAPRPAYSRRAGSRNLRTMSS
jgi:hypothetical protein